MNQASKRSEPTHLQEGPSRYALRAHSGVVLIETRDDPKDGVAGDLLRCSHAGRQSCFLLVWWEEDRLVQVEMFWTEAEARACLAHGRLYDLREFAIPSEARRFM